MEEKGTKLIKIFKVDEELVLADNIREAIDKYLKFHENDTSNWYDKIREEDIKNVSLFCEYEVIY